MTGRAVRVALGEVLTEARERVEVEAEQEYPIAGVYGFGRGILLRDAVSGGSISAPHLFRIGPRQIIYSRLKAFEGAFAVVPAHAAGRFVSNEFPTFDVDDTRALPEFIALVLQQRHVWRSLTERITGVGARRERLQVRDFLEFEIDLPSLNEQRRIFEAVNTAHRAAVGALAEGQAARDLAIAMHDDLLESADCATVPLGELLDRNTETVAIVDDGNYQQVKLRIRGRGIALRGVARGSAIKTKRQYRIRADQLLVSRIDARNGAFAVVPRELDGAIVTQDFPAFNIDGVTCLPQFLAVVVSRPEFWDECASASSGSTNRVRLNVDEFLELDVELPAVDDQMKVAAAFDSAAAADTEAEATAALTSAVAARLLAEVTNAMERSVA